MMVVMQEADPLGRAWQRSGQLTVGVFFLVIVDHIILVIVVVVDSDWLTVVVIVGAAAVIVVVIVVGILTRQDIADQEGFHAS